MYYIMANAWMSHLNNTRKQNPGLNLSQAMKRASKTYKKKRNQRGGKPPSLGPEEHSKKKQYHPHQHPFQQDGWGEWAVGEVFIGLEQFCSRHT